MGPSINIIHTCAKDDWDGYVRSHPNGSIYHSFAWREVIEKAFSKKTYYLCAKDMNGKVCGVLPLVRLRCALVGDFLVSMPYCNYGGVLADTSEIETQLSIEAKTIGRTLGCDTLELRNLGRVDWPNWILRSDKVLLALNLPDSSEKLWKTIGSKCRAQIRRPLKEHTEILHGGAELIPDFYNVFCRNIRDLGTPVYPKSFFETIVEVLKAKVHIIVIKVGDRPVASCFLIGHENVMEIPWAASKRDYNRLGVNMLLYWEALKYAMDNGFSRFDFGRSSRDSGTFHFKRQWGAEEKEIPWAYWFHDGRGSTLGFASGLRMRLAVRVWSKIPLPIANWLGPKISPSLPW